MSTEQENQKHQEPRKRGDRWLLWGILLLFLFGLGIRGYAYLTGSPQDAQPHIARDATYKGSSSTLREGETKAIQPDVQETSGQFDLIKLIAPYLTEGGLSFFLGFCIGYFLRVVAKIFILLAGAMYVCLILLSHYGVITVDWGSFQHIAQQILLNTKTQIEGLQGILTVGLPSVGMGCLGIWRGLKKN